MKRLFLILLFLSVPLFAQAKPKFQAFTGTLLRIHEAIDGYHEFSMRIISAPWAFHVQGRVKSPGGDPDAIFNALFERELVGVLAYIPSPSLGTDGKEYETGIFNFMIYYYDSPTIIQDFSIKLMAPANDSWAKESFQIAKTAGEALTSLWKGDFDKEITRAAAVPLTRKRLNQKK